MVSIDTIVDEAAGAEAGALVLLPSSSRDSEDFDDVAGMFAAEGFRVLRPQPRGMGGSTGPMRDLTLHDYARDVAEVIRRLGDGDAIVLGHAFGQWIGRCVAADHPHLVRGVVLAAAAAKSVDPMLRENLSRCVDTSLPDSERLAALRHAFFAPGHDPSVWLSNWHPGASVSQRAASAATPQSDWWGAGAAPVLDIIAEHDPWRPIATRTAILDELGASRVTVTVIPDASHALIPEQPRAVVLAVTAWVRTLTTENHDA